MTPDLPASNLDGIDELSASGRRTLPPGSGSSGRHPLPAPWPQPEASQPFPGVQDVLAAPSVMPENWLPEPTYWLADHQAIPRPPTAPVPRPQRFRPISRGRSTLLLLVILLGIVLLFAGMLLAGRISYDLFNSPSPIHYGHPAGFIP